MTFNVDFDYTCIIPTHPNLDIGAERVLKMLVDKGHEIILFTCRSNQPFEMSNGKTDHNGLDKAVKWFEDRDIPLYGIQINPKQYLITRSKKSLADIMIDDTALGCPLIYDEDYSDRPFVDWEKVERILIKKKII